jgi:hypothetical protein
MNRKKLPIGIQTFSEIRTENYYYADKTDFCFKLASQGKYYFLSRPRRFGKSLLIDTIGELFAGNAPLFEGIDMTVKFNDNIYLFEFKVVEFVPEGKALQQLQNKNYAQKYQFLQQPIHLIGVEFSKEARSVVGFDYCIFAAEVKT